MGYRNLQELVSDLEHHQRLLRVDCELDADLEIAEICRRVYQNQGPALLFTRVKNCQFPILGNLFGTLERTRFLFRDTLKSIEWIMQGKADPKKVLKNYSQTLQMPWKALNAFPKKKSYAPVMDCTCQVSDLPQLKSWPDDGGAFITLPQVYSEDPLRPGFRFSNLGMYRVQLSGNEYISNQEVGLHYQIHRGIGVHHSHAKNLNKSFPVNIFVGGAPAMTLAAVMPLPEGLPELYFAGLLAGHRIPMVSFPGELPFYGEADFCLQGEVLAETKLEGPFGDHLGYYSLKHPMPVLKIKKVYHRRNAIWPITVVGRPPQEDTSFGHLIHELTGDVIPTELPGVKEIHAVDASGVHPLLLAIGSERYTPYDDPGRPQEILTQANAILGKGQLSLAKYLMIISDEEGFVKSCANIPEYFQYLLERIDFSRDLHFQTQTTMDTLDYSAPGLNQGSKLVLAARGKKRRTLAKNIPAHLHLPEGFSCPSVAMPGVLLVQAPAWRVGQEDLRRFADQIQMTQSDEKFPLIVLVDDTEFAARNLNNFLWITFTRSDPARDIDGQGAFIENKHWGCRGALVIDARVKDFHAPPLIEDPLVSKKIDDLAAPGKPLFGLF